MNLLGYNFFCQGILEEIEEERQKCASISDEPVDTNLEETNGIVLVACRDEHSCMQLEEFITNGPKKVTSTIMC